MAKTQIPTLEEIRSWARAKGWTIHGPERGDFRLYKRIQISRKGDPFIMRTEFETRKRFRALCGHLMDADKWKWRDKK